MRRTPYVENNERLAMKYTNQLRAKDQRKAAEIKIYQPELDALAKSIRPHPNEGAGKTWLGAVMRRPVTGKHSHPEGAVAETSRTRDSKNCKEAVIEVEDRRLSESDFRRHAATPANMRYQMPVRARSTNKSDLFVSTMKDESFNGGKLYRTSLKGDEPKVNLSYHRKESTPTAAVRYEKDKPKPSRGFSNPRSSKDGKSERRPVEGSVSRPLEMYERKQAATSKKPQKPEQAFFEYVLRYSYRTKKGFMPNNPGKPNQDSYIISPNINKKSWQHYFGVCDGHGVLGHLVSSFIKNHLPAVIARTRNLERQPAEGLFKAFQQTMEQLVLQSKIDLTFSGSTVVGCYLLQDKLYCCNVGDSRAIIGSYDEKSKKWSAKALSNDHKPAVKSEAERIARCGGRVEAFKDPEGSSIGPLRVWLKEQNVPGLAMTRSFGDLVAASVGVSSDPQILQYTMTQSDRIILIASDGVWEFLQNEDLVNLLSPFYESKKIEQACDLLLETALGSWTKECSVVDDITFILLFMSYSDVN